MRTKILVIAIIRRDDTILLRKKSDGAPPYKEPWYLFGGELVPGKTPEQAVNEVIAVQAGIQVRMVEQLTWDTEVKADLDGETKLFVYLDTIFEYVSGEARPGPDVERVEWAPIDKLGDYQHVPPGVVLFRKMGYL